MPNQLVRADGTPRRSLAPSAVARGLAPQAREFVLTYGWWPVLGGLVVGFYAMPYAAAPVWLLAVAVGSCRTFALLHRGEAPRGWQTGGRVLALTTAATVVLPITAALGFPRVAVLLGLGVLELLLYRPRSFEAAPESRLSHSRLVAALITAEVVKADPAPMLSYQGPPRVDDWGVTAVVKITPPTVTWQQVRAKHERIAAALDLPARRLEVSHEPDWSPNTVRFWVATGTPAPRKLTLTERCDWSQPILLGEDARGRSSWFHTRGRHSVFVGQTGSGKTHAARAVVARALLDPSVALYVIDGKDSASDWRPCAPLCVEYVGGSGADAVRQAVRVLEAVEELRENRRDAGSDVGDVVLVVEEVYKLRRAAARIDKALVERLDGLLGELAATARSARIHIVMCAQRGTVKYLPGELQANLTQRVLGQVSDKAEARYVLDLTPTVLPSAAGEFLVGEDGREPVLITTPHLDDDGWRKVCELAAELRSLADRGDTATCYAKPLPAHQNDVIQLVTPSRSPLVDAVLELLAAAGGPLTATELYELLPSDVRPAAPLALGKALRDVPEVVRKHRGNRPAWTLGTLGNDQGAPSAAPSAEGQNGRVHAQEGFSAPAPSAPSVQP